MYQLTNVIYPVFDMEVLIGVIGWTPAADLLEALDASDISEKDYWIVQRAAEAGFEQGLHTLPVAQQ